VIVESDSDRKFKNLFKQVKILKINYFVLVCFRFGGYVEGAYVSVSD
jgi:hypothetical protein